MSPRAELLLACQELRDAFTKVAKLCERYKVFPKLRPSHETRSVVLSVDKWITRFNNDIEHISAHRKLSDDPNSGQTPTSDATLNHEPTN